VVLTLVAGIPGEDHPDDLTAATDRLGLADQLLDRAR
jgi:hypothetical protein